MRKSVERLPKLAPQPEPARVVPSDLALERARQKQAMAELRYDLAVRKGTAWDIQKAEDRLKK